MKLNIIKKGVPSLKFTDISLTIPWQRAIHYTGCACSRSRIAYMMLQCSDGLASNGIAWTKYHDNRQGQRMWRTGFYIAYFKYRMSPGSY